VIVRCPISSASRWFFYGKAGGRHHYSRNCTYVLHECNGRTGYTSFDDFEAAWRTNTFGAFAAARSVIPAMKRRAAGHIIFVGATASRRGGAKTVAFASAKAAQRSLAESLARSLGPSKIHVSLIIIDGIVDEPSIRTKLADKPDSFFVKPDDIADTALMLTRQKPSAWTFELEARPFGETW
jgi:NAD(P)-dependent dehydrogenase (short-subunit alcohol dehydrogenase family)